MELILNGLLLLTNMGNCRLKLCMFSHSHLNFFSSPIFLLTVLGVLWFWRSSSPISSPALQQKALIDFSCPMEPFHLDPTNLGLVNSLPNPVNGYHSSLLQHTSSANTKLITVRKWCRIHANIRFSVGSLGSCAPGSSLYLKQNTCVSLACHWTSISCGSYKSSASKLSPLQDALSQLPGQACTPY